MEKAVTAIVEARIGKIGERTEMIKISQCESLCPLGSLALLLRIHVNRSKIKKMPLLLV